MTTKTPPTDPGLDEAITSVLSEMKNHKAHSDEFAKCVDQLDKLYKMKTSEKKEPSTKSKEAWIGAGANVVGILSILGFESFGHVISTKALGFVAKARI